MSSNVRPAPQRKVLLDDIRHELERGNVKAADELVAAAQRRWPGSIGLKLLKGEVLEASGSTVEAVDHYRLLQDENQDDHRASLRLVRLLTESGAVAEAHRVFLTRVIPSGAPKEPKSKLAVALAERIEKAEDAAAFLDALQDEGLGAAAAINLATLAWRHEDWKRALAFLDRVGRHGRLPHESLSLYADLLLRVDRVREARSVLTKLCASPIASPHHAQRLIRLHRLLGEVGCTCEDMRRSLVRWPTSAVLIGLPFRLALQPKATQELFEIIRANERRGGFDDMALLAYANACLQLGDEQAAVSALRRIRPDSPAGQRADLLLGAIKALPLQGRRAPPRLKDDQSREIQIVRVAGATATLFVFTDLSGNMVPLPVGSFDALLSRYAANIVYLRDNHRLSAYLEGIASLAPTLAGTIAALRVLAGELGGSRVATLGASLGGFAAIRYGAMLGAEAAASLAGPTTLDESVLQGMGVELNARAGRFQGRMKMRFDRDNGADIMPDIQRHPTMQVVQVYGTSHARDVGFARRLERLPNVVFEPLEAGNNHQVLLYLLAWTAGRISPMQDRADTKAR